MKTKWKTIKVWSEGPVGRLLLNRPRELNALNHEAACEIELAVRELERQTRVIVLQGAGKSFCSGADLHYLAATSYIHQFINQINRALFCIEEASVPVIAAVQGHALAGGFELMQACDIVLVADNAIIGDQHANFGLIPGAGGSQRLPRFVGRQRALALLLSGERLTGREAADWGLAYRSVAVQKLENQALALAKRIAAKSQMGLRRMKCLVDQSSRTSLHEGINTETQLFLNHIRSDDAQEGLSAFQKKRTPYFA